MAHTPLRRLGFLRDAWVPVSREHMDAYTASSLQRTAKTVKKYGRKTVTVDYERAVEKRDATLGIVTSRAEVLTSTLSILIAAHIALAISLEAKNELAADVLLAGSAVLLVIIGFVVSTLFLHWAEDLATYDDADREFKRTVRLALSRAIRINRSIQAMYLVIFVEIAAFPIHLIYQAAILMRATH